MRRGDVGKGDTVRFMTATGDDLAVGLIEETTPNGLTIRVGAVQGTNTRNGRTRRLIGGTVHVDVPIDNVIRKVR